MHLTATHINYWHVCHRKLWLFAHGLQMEHTSDVVYEGKMLHETAYSQRAVKGRELELSVAYGEDTLSAKVDYFDASTLEIHEIKKSAKVEQAHEAQVKFYLWVLQLSGVAGVGGILEYPLLRQTHKIELFDEDKEHLAATVMAIKELVNAESCPPILKKTFCKSCSYFDFCWAAEAD